MSAHDNRSGASTLREHGPGAKVLYLSYDGMTDPLGQSQVLPYLRGLAERGFEISVASFEKPDRLGRVGASVRALLEDAGIRWYPLKYTKRPPVLSTVWDIARLRRHAFRLHRQTPFDLVHCRSYIPAIVGLALRRQQGVPFIFDTRGFYPEEKVEGGWWNLRNPVFRAVYRYFKGVEAASAREAGTVVIQSHAGRAAMLKNWDALRHAGTPVEVIPCSADFQLFRPSLPAERSAVRAELGIPPNALTLVYLGSLGTWYLLDEMLDFFAVLQQRRPGAKFLFITVDAPEPILASATQRGIAPDAVVVRPGRRDQIQHFLGAADVGILFTRISPSKSGSSPVKLGEYLAMGLPVVANPGVGDVQEILEATQAGVLVDGFDRHSYERAIQRLEELGAMKPETIRQRAAEIYDLEQAIARYADLYHRILDGNVTPFAPAAAAS